MDWQLVVPGETGWKASGVEKAREVRLRPGQPVTVVRGDGIWQGSHALTPAEVTQAAQALSGYTLAAHREMLNSGFVPLAGGHRLGVCGVMGPCGLSEITSVCVRLAHEIQGAGTAVYPLIRGYSTLIIGPPGAGKTTLLRDLIRLYSLDGFQAGAADERGEIAACREGQPCLDVGPMTDVVTGMEKGKALGLLLRSMAPQVIATDEIGGEEDAAAVQEALRCGVIVLATAHGRNAEDARKRRELSALLHGDAFEKIVCLSGTGETSQVLSWNGREWR